MKGNLRPMARLFFLSLVAISTLAVMATPAFAAAEKAVFAGGCFWGVEDVFEHVKGVIDVRSGYAGGRKETANYDAVGGGETKHAETVEIMFDPAKVTYEQLLYIFFVVAHDPTEVNRQGPDVGPQYRSVVFFVDRKQENAAKAFVRALNSSKAFTASVATEIVPFVDFFPAENYHQDFVKNNPTHPYVVTHDAPKLVRLKAKFPNLYRE